MSPTLRAAAQPGPLTLNLSVTPSVMLTVNSAILGGRAFPFLRSGSYSVLVFTTTLARKQRGIWSVVSQMCSDPSALSRWVWDCQVQRYPPFLQALRILHKGGFRDIAYSWSYSSPKKKYRTGGQRSDANWPRPQE